jgi:hypothetical protein
MNNSAFEQISKCALEIENRFGIRKRIYPGFDGFKLSFVFRFQTVKHLVAHLTGDCKTICDASHAIAREFSYFWMCAQQIIISSFL